MEVEATSKHRFEMRIVVKIRSPKSVGEKDGYLRRPLCSNQRSTTICTALLRNLLVYQWGFRDKAAKKQCDLEHYLDRGEEHKGVRIPPWSWNLNVG